MKELKLELQKELKLMDMVEQKLYRKCEYSEADMIGNETGDLKFIIVKHVEGKYYGIKVQFEDGFETHTVWIGEKQVNSILEMEAAF
ncbi:hypothetical protein [Liquorilactobacillus vini]|uniref:hypothetical protein n=1 Tax=Liquorilactobacillus vini TaxID=238015 RepID=UPI0003134C91|nr:hypothetical protein [Liquorilactobacillus vini]